MTDCYQLTHLSFKGLRNTKAL